VLLSCGGSLGSPRFGFVPGERRRAEHPFVLPNFGRTAVGTAANQIGVGGIFAWSGVISVQESSEICSKSGQQATGFHGGVYTSRVGFMAETTLPVEGRVSFRWALLVSYSTNQRATSAPLIDPTAMKIWTLNASAAMRMAM